MILYVNGDSHTAAAEAVNTHCFAEDDGRLIHLGRLPHPENLAVSWGKNLADMIKFGFKCDAESAASNSRILRTTRAWINQRVSLDDVLVIIQWTTWEREEWFIDGTYYQINASGIDHVPEDHQLRYRQFIADVDWKVCTEKWHEQIWDFHRELDQKGIKHIFFNGNNHFGSIAQSQRRDWGANYLGPYDANLTYDSWLKSHGCRTVSPESWHFGREAHAKWANYMLQYAVANHFV